MLQRFLHNRTAMFTVAIVLLTALVGIFAESGKAEAGAH